LSVEFFQLRRSSGFDSSSSGHHRPLRRCPASSPPTAHSHPRHHGRRVLVSARLQNPGHNICAPWPRSCDRQPFEPAVLACAAGRAKPNVSMRAAEPPARTAQRACTTATCRPTR
jgi:hypothetical protein